MNKISLAFLMVILTAVCVTAHPSAVRAEAEGSHGMKMAPQAAIGGYCPVALSKGMKMMGSDHFVTEYKGKIYKFANFEAQKMFLANPENYIQDLDAKLKKLNEAPDMKTMNEGSQMMGEGSQMMEEGSYMMQEGSH